MNSEREERRRRQAGAKGNRQDVRFFERHPERRFRVRKAVPGEFAGAETHVLVHVEPDPETGEHWTRKRAFTGDTKLPDDEATAEYLATLIEGVATLDRAEPLEIMADLGLPEPAAIRFTFPARMH